MAKIVAITGCVSGIAHTLMAAEALKKAAALMGHEIKVETTNTGGPRVELTAADIAEADVAIVASDVYIDPRRFAEKPMVAVPVSDAIRKTRAVIESALAEIAVGDGSSAKAQAVDYARPGTANTQGAATPPVIAPASTSNTAKSIVAITACPTGIAHTFMAAAALKKGAAAMGHNIRVETQGSVGAKDALTDDEIRAADAVIIAADTFVDTARFSGKRLYQTTTKAALHDGGKVIGEALAAPVPAAGDLANSVEKLKKDRSAKVRTGPYKHLMTGVSYMLPLVTAAGLCIALAFAIGGINAGDAGNAGRLGFNLKMIGGIGFDLIVPVLSAFIAYSIADRPGLAAGLVGGAIATTLHAGFLGGIASGFLAGYVTKAMSDFIPLPQTLSGLKPVLILPLLSTVVVGCAMLYVLGPPIAGAQRGLTSWLNSMGSGNAAVLGLLLGAMMAFDLGGPVNKAAYAFGTGLLQQGVGGPMAAVMAAGMTPPLALALAATLFKNRFTTDERGTAGATAVLGISFITEGAIPFAAKDPLRVIPCLMLGSAVTGAISMGMKVGLVVPHGGIFVLLIPNAVQHLVPYIIAIVAGTLATTTIALWIAKRPIKDDGVVAAH